MSSKIDFDILYSNGFFLFDIALSNEIDLLNQLYTNFFEKDKQDNINNINTDHNGTSVTHNSGDSHRARLISEQIYKILNEPLSKAFPEYDYFLGHFVIKEKQSFNHFKLHRDWNLVDESIHQTIQVWIPHSISYPENGGMCFIPRSQFFDNCPRSGSLGFPYIEIEKKIYPYLSISRLLPGQAVCFLNSVFHGSFSNPTNDKRVATLINLIPKGAPTNYIHFVERENVLQTYSVTAEDIYKELHNLEKGHSPSTELRSEIPAIGIKKQGQVSGEKLISWIRADRLNLALPEKYEFKQLNILKDLELEKEINTNGYSVMDFVDKTETVTIRNLFQDSLSLGNSYYTIENGNSRELINFVKEKLDQFFKDHIYSIRILKITPDSLYSDWYEAKLINLNSHLEPIYDIWYPLSDENHDWQISIIPQSHKIINRMHDRYFTSPTDTKKRVLDKFERKLSISNHNAFILDSRLVYKFGKSITSTQTYMKVQVAHKDTSFIDFDVSESAQTIEIYKKSNTEFYGEDVNDFVKKIRSSTKYEMHMFPYNVSEEEFNLS